MMAKYLKIASCCQCKHYSRNETTFPDWCALSPERFITTGPIPDWCPLKENRKSPMLARASR